MNDGVAILPAFSLGDRGGLQSRISIGVGVHPAFLMSDQEVLHFHKDGIHTLELVHLLPVDVF